MNSATLLFLHNGFLTISRQAGLPAGRPAGHNQPPGQQPSSVAPAQRSVQNGSI